MARLNGLSGLQAWPARGSCVLINCVLTTSAESLCTELRCAEHQWYQRDKRNSTTDTIVRPLPRMLSKNSGKLLERKRKRRVLRKMFNPVNGNGEWRISHIEEIKIDNIETEI